jgi:hypothetical protein
MLPGEGGAMTGHHSGTIVPFERVRRRRAPRTGRGAEVPASPAPWIDTWPPLDDVGLNVDWDRLVALVMQAWCWRDPESVGAVERCLRRLKSVVDRDWS